MQKSPRNGLDQIALALPVMHTGHSSKRCCPVLSHHNFAFVPKGNMGILSMLLEQGHTAKGRVDVSLSGQQDVQPSAKMSGHIMLPTFQGVRSGPTAFSRALKTANRASKDS